MTSSGTPGSGSTCSSDHSEPHDRRRVSGRESRAADRKRQHRDTLRPTKDGNRSLAADAFSPATVGSARAEYDNDYYWQATGQCAARRGGAWPNGAYVGLFCLNVGRAPSGADSSLGFRGVC